MDKYHNCSTGASIAAMTSDVLSALSGLLYNSACFAIYEDPLVAPTDWDNVSICSYYSPAGIVCFLDFRVGSAKIL